MQRTKNISFRFSLLLASSLIAFIIMLHILPGIVGQPKGEDLRVHVALAKTILNGSFLNPPYSKIELYPASNEALLALLIVLHLPVNTFNILGIIFLFAVSIYLGKVFRFRTTYALYFAFAVCFAYGVLRFLLTQTIDIWLLAYFLLTLALLHRPKPTLFYYLILGFSSGMLLGSRFSSPATILTLYIFYIQNFVTFANKKRILVFFGMISIFGLFWYLRNLIVAGDPFYPQPFLMFKGSCHTVCSWLIWNVLTSIMLTPSHIVSAFISEYMIWSLIFLALPLFFIVTLVTRIKEFSLINTLLLIGLLNSILYLFFPSWKYLDSVIVGVRYSFPAYGVFMLALFLLAKQYKQEELVEIITFANLTFLILPFSYHPKLLFLYVPVLTAIIYFLRKLYVLKTATKTATAVAKPRQSGKR